MAYTKTNWTEETAITTARLNNMETQYDEAAGYADAKRADADEILKCEIVATLPTAAQAHAGRIVFNLEDGQFYGGTGVKWKVFGVGAEFPGQTEAQLKLGSGISKFDLVHIYSGLVKTEMLDEPPAGSSSRCVSISADGNYIIRGYEYDPRFIVYKKVNGEFTEMDLSSLASYPSNHASAVAVSSNGTYLAASSSSGQSPYIYLYKRVGDSVTKLSNPSGLPPTGFFDMAFSSDDVYLAGVNYASSDATKRLHVYKRSGDAFSLLSSPTSQPPASYAEGVAFSQDVAFLAAVGRTSPFVHIYKRSGDSFNKLSNPAQLPEGAAYSVAFSPDGTLLAVGLEATPYLALYGRSGDTFTKLDLPMELPAGLVDSIAFSPDSRFLICGHNNPPYITLYERDGDNFTKQPDPTYSLLGTGRGVKFSPDGTYLVVAHGAVPAIVFFNHFVEPTVFRSEGQIEELRLAAGAGYAMEPGTVGETKRVMMLWK